MRVEGCQCLLRVKCGYQVIMSPYNIYQAKLSPLRYTLGILQMIPYILRMQGMILSPNHYFNLGMTSSLITDIDRASTVLHLV